MPQCSHPPHCPHHQRRLANCDWMPASYTSGLPSHPHKHPTCWASSQCSHTVSRTACHRAWTSTPLSAHPSIECCCTAPQIENPFVLAAQLIGSSDNNNIRAARWADHQWNAEWANNSTRLRTSIPDNPPGMTLTRRAWVRLNLLSTSGGRFRSCLYKWGMTSSAACECGVEEQTVDHVVIQCPIHRPPHGLHGLTVLDDETTEWLLNTCTEI